MSAHEKELAQLRGGSLSLKDVIAQSVGFNGPVFSVAALLPLVVVASQTGKGAGVATPIVVIIVGIGMLAVYWIISRYAKRIHACGALYDYVGDGFGQRAGFLAGWVYYAATTALWLATVLAFGGFANGFLLSVFGLDVSWWILSLIFLAGTTAVLVLGVRVSTRAQLALVLVSALVVFGFSLSVIFQGGNDGLSLAPLNPTAVSFSDLFYGFVYAILMYVGIESAANMAEETSEPKKSIPRAIMLALGLIGVYFFVCAYSQAVGFGLHAKVWASAGGGFPLFALGSGQFGSKALGDALQLMVVFDVAAVTIGAGNATSRGLLSMARDGRLSRRLARVHARHATPVTAIGLLVGLSALLIVLIATTDGLLSRATPDPTALLPQWFPMFSWLAAFGGLGITLVYLVVSLAAIRGLWELEHKGLLTLAGVVGAAVSVGAIFGAVYKAPSPLDVVPWVMLAFIVLGALWLGVLVSRGPLEAGDLSPATDDLPMQAS